MMSNSISSIVGRHRASLRLFGLSLLTIAVLIALNWAASHSYLRLDLTANQIYTLSPVSQDAASDLDEPVQIQAFISPNLPPPYHRLHQQIDELLQEYEAHSQGQISYEIISTDDEDRLTELAEAQGISPITIGQETDTQASYRSIFAGIAFHQGERSETINQLQVSGDPSLDSFEYDVTRALLGLTFPTPRKVGLIAGAGGPADIPQFASSLQPIIENRYGHLLEVEAVDLTAPNLIGADLRDYEALIAINLSNDLGTSAIDALDQFIDEGGNIGWFQSGAVVDPADQMRWAQAQQRGDPEAAAAPPMREPVDTDFHRFLANFGIHPGNDAVIHRDNAIAYGPVPTQRGTVQVAHPALFPITDIDRDLPFTRHISHLFLPLPSTIGVNHDNLPPQFEFHDILRTDPGSTRFEPPPGRALYDDLILPIQGEEQGDFRVGAALQGPDNRFLVIGSGDFMQPFPEVGYQGQLTSLGLDFFVASIEWLAQERELATIRGKQMPALITDIPSAARTYIQIINIILVPAFFFAIGLVMYARRLRRRRELTEAFADSESSSDESDATEPPDDEQATSEHDDADPDDEDPDDAESSSATKTDDNPTAEATS